MYLSVVLPELRVRRISGTALSSDMESLSARVSGIFASYVCRHSQAWFSRSSGFISLVGNIACFGLMICRKTLLRTILFTFSARHRPSKSLQMDITAAIVLRDKACDISRK
jgi:hypothetical protein